MIKRRGTVNAIRTWIIMISLVVSTGTFTHAAELPDVIDNMQIEAAAKYVETVVGVDDVCKVSETGTKFVNNNGGVTISIPKDPHQFITMEGESIETIGMSLPEELKAEKGVSTDEGTVVYQSHENVDICVQAITNEQDGIAFDGIREMVTIKDARAPREYTYNLDIPDDYEIITSEDYCKRMNMRNEKKEFVCEEEPGWVYVIDNENQIKSVFAPAWARDANGNAIETFYTIEGNALTQIVKFDENSIFPIVADPDSHPNKVVTKKLNQSQVEGIIANCDSSENTVIFCSVAGAGVSIPKVAKLLKKIPYASGAYLYFTIGKAAADVYLAKKKKTYKKYLKQMKKENKKLEEKTIYKYGRSNSRHGYYVYQITCKVV